MKNVKEILDSLASPIPSKWREKAEWRRANRHWLKKSQKIALTILECMSSRKMTQKQLSEKMEVTPQYVSKILKGSENLTLETISKVESVLGIEIIVINSYSTQQFIPAKWQNIAEPKYGNTLNSGKITIPLKDSVSYGSEINPAA